jgi:hypothetical protein
MSEPRKHKSGGQNTAAERQRARRQRLADAGLAQVTVVVPTGREAEIKAIAERMTGDRATDLLAGHIVR